MKRARLFIIVFLLFPVGISAWAQAAEAEQSTAAVDSTPEIEILVLEDGAEEVQEIVPVSAYAPMVVDEPYLAVEADARQRIDAILAQIQELADPSDEGQLQKQIEQIKLEAEVERLSLFQEDAEVREDYELADELADEIEHLGRIDEPVIGYQEGQQPQQVNE